MNTMASLITSLTIVYSTVYSGTDEREHQSSALLAFVRGIHRWPVNSPHKGQVTRKMFPFDDVIMVRCHSCCRSRSCWCWWYHCYSSLKWEYHSGNFLSLTVPDAVISTASGAASDTICVRTLIISLRWCKLLHQHKWFKITEVQRNFIENIRIFCSLCGEFTSHRWIPLTKASNGALMFSLICAWTNGQVNNRDAGDLRRHRSHYDVTVMAVTIWSLGWAMIHTSYRTFGDEQLPKP